MSCLHLSVGALPDFIRIYERHSIGGYLIPCQWHEHYSCNMELFGGVIFMNVKINVLNFSFSFLIADELL